MIRLLILVVLISAGCAPRSPSAQGPQPPQGTGADSLIGTLRVVGSAPMNTRLVIQSAAGSTSVGGPSLDELRRLAGAEVVLRGRIEGQEFIAADYAIRSIDGRAVTMGRVEAISGGYVQLRTAEGELVYLVSAPGDLRVGQKIWVQGPRGVLVQSHGVVRP